uniref:Inter-alpha-trypsin inhibitor heavy chain 3b, tandem duplicate 1 n=1 Tax=Myripristis murdjan TaxID=586833 RepID=A0A667YEA3_9TELE
MVRAVAQSILLGLLLAFVTTAPNKEDWDIYSFHINSTVTSRYAITVITSRVVNRMDEPKEIEFHVRIPKNAFISKFRMLIDGQMYDGIVKAKEEAQQQYNEAVSRGQSAGLVSSVGRTLEEFKTSVTVAALQKVTFELTYEELLIRRLGKYELQIHARPMQPVKDFKIDIHINEKAGINFLEVKGGLSTKTLANAITKTQTHDQAWVYFYPTEDQQKICDSCGEQGMNGDLVIVYDVLRSNPLGEIKSDGYFVHHFAPGDLPRIPKNVVFIIDRSGSMHGRKIEQTRAALLQILGDLAEDDYFGLITFNGNISPWKRELLQATQSNLDAAKDFARKIRDSGATNINDAVLEGARMLNEYTREGSASLLILLTDGDPTTGVTNIQKIQSNVREAIDKKFPLYCLGFGFDVNFEFLEKMALENSGVARRIYEDFDADLQLRGFYEEVATPLLTDVMMIYIGGTNLTQTNFSQYYNGSEIVVAGQITDNSIETFSPQVVAISVRTVPHFSHVWYNLSFKHCMYLSNRLQLAGAEKMKVRKEALELSLKYSFVTPLTSMVVTKPPGEDTQVLHKPKEGEEPQTSHGSRPFVRGGLRASSGMRKASGSRQGKMHPQLMSKFMPETFLIVQRHAHSLQQAGRQTKNRQQAIIKAELSVNGELDSTAYSGFRKIAIHYKSDQHIEFDTTGITVRDGQSVKFFHWGQDHTSVGRCLIMRDKETDVSAGDARMIILLHERKGEKFLWPAMRQFPSGNSTDGLLKWAFLSFLCRADAVDYSISATPSQQCWLVLPRSVLQRELSDFIVTQL